MTQKHTPTPEEAISALNDIADDYERLAFPEDDEQVRTRRQAILMSALRVRNHYFRACNAREELVAALRAIVETWHRDDANFERELSEGTPEWLSIARAALKTAEGV